MNPNTQTTTEELEVQIAALERLVDHHKKDLEKALAVGSSDAKEIRKYIIELNREILLCKQVLCAKQRA